ncbi:hypothetical protein ACFQ0B_65135 [Nonomuraea thailandensis]
MGYKLADEVAINAPKATPPRDLLALIAIARRINDATRTGWLTREEIAHWARIDVRSVKAMRERLVEAGLLVVLETGAAAGRRPCSTSLRCPGTCRGSRRVPSIWSSKRDLRTSPYRCRATRNGEVQTSRFSCG